MTQKQKDAIRNAAQKISNALNMYTETLDELVADTIRGRTDRLDDLTTPECHCRRGSKCGHTLPAWFIRDAAIGHQAAQLRHYASVARREQ